jgi:hypothetical protein
MEKASSAAAISADFPADLKPLQVEQGAARPREMPSGTRGSTDGGVSLSLRLQKSLAQKKQLPRNSLSNWRRRHSRRKERPARHLPINKGVMERHI